MFRQVALGMIFCMQVVLLAGSVLAEECRLAYTAKVHYAPQILALRNGWFADGKVQVRGVDLGMSAGIAAAEALVSGSADVAVMGDVPAVYALASARPCVLIASYGGGESMHSLVVAGASGIKEPKDLAGRRIGVHFGSSTHGAIAQYLKEHGLFGSVTLVNIRQSSLVEALASGDIDGLAASEPSPSLAVKKVKGARHLAALGGLGNQYPLMIVASKKYAEKHPEAIRVLVAGMQQAVSFINRDAASAGEELSKATGVAASLEQAALAKLDWKVSLDEEIIKSLEQTADFLLSIGRLKKKPDIRTAAKPEFVQ